MTGERAVGVGAPLDAVLERLRAIEAEHRVRVLFACESGSRAWGFASTDSDYDVRFIYVHALDWYLSIDAHVRRDVIEQPIEGLWDVNGWDLKKALGLLAKSNPPLLEWLASPIVYRSDAAFVARLGELAENCYRPRSCFLHYLNMSNANHREYLKGEEVWRKQYFYLLRPLLACRWIERDLAACRDTPAAPVRGALRVSGARTHRDAAGGPPPRVPHPRDYPDRLPGRVPMEFATLLHGTGVDAVLIDSVERLLAEKRAGEELGRGPRDPVIDAFVNAERIRLEGVLAAIPRSPPVDLEPLHGFFRDEVLDVERP